MIIVLVVIMLLMMFLSKDKQDIDPFASYGKNPVVFKPPKPSSNLSAPIVNDFEHLSQFMAMKIIYMDGPQWDSKRKARLKFDSYTCQSCGATGVSLEVHHERGYDLIPNEGLKCLKSLCRDCHQAEHDKHGYPQGYEGYMTWNKPITKRD